MKEIEIKLLQSLSEMEERLINEFKSNFILLLKESGCKLNQYVYDDDLDIEDDTIQNILSSVLKNIAIISEKIDWNAFFEQFNGEYYKNIDQFLLWLQEYVDERSKAYIETSFVRKLSYTELQKILSYCFTEYILVINDIEDEKYGLKREQIKILIKLLRTLIEMIIEKNYSRTTSWTISYEMFSWEEDTFECFWEIINQNREVLWRNIVMQKLNNIEGELNRIKEKVYTPML